MSIHTNIQSIRSNIQIKSEIQGYPIKVKILNQYQESIYFIYSYNRFIDFQFIFLSRLLQNEMDKDAFLKNLDVIKVIQYQLNLDVKQVIQYQLNLDVIKVIQYQLNLDVIKVIQYQLNLDVIKVIQFQLNLDVIKVIQYKLNALNPKKIRLYLIHQIPYRPGQDYNVRKAKCSCVYSAFILKPVLSGRNL